MATRKEAAKALGVTPQALFNWWKDQPAWFPLDAVQTDRSGRAIDWDLPRIQAAYAAKNGQTNSGGNGDLTAIQRVELATKAEKLKQQRLTTQRMEREEQIRQGNILDREEWTLFARESIVICRDQIAALPKLLARLAGPQERAKILAEGTRIVNLKLSQLADALAQGPDQES